MEISKDLIAASSTPLVLAILAEGDSYGYAIIKRVGELSGGRKYYRITSQGRDQLAHERRQWQAVSETLRGIWQFTFTGSPDDDVCGTYSFA